MAAEISFPRPTITIAQICLFVAIAVLAIIVELLIVRAILNNTNSIDNSQRADTAITNMANVQREALLLQLETDRLLLDPEASLDRLELRRALLANQLRIHTLQVLPDTGVHTALEEIQVELNGYDVMLADFKDAEVPARPAIAREMMITNARVERLVKAVYDQEEQSVFLAASEDLQTQRTSQVLMLSVGALVLVLGGILAFSLRRSFRALRKEMAERARAEAAERHRNLELETLFHIAGILVQPGQFHDRCESVLEDLARICDADSATLRILDDKEQVLHLLAQAGPAPLEQSVDLSLQSVSGTAVSRGEVIAANDYSSHPLANRSFIERGIKSMVSVPIKFGAQSGRAVLNVISSKPAHFTEERIRLLSAIGDGLGALLDQAKLSQDLQSNLEEMAGADEVARIITSTLDIEELYEKFPVEMKKLVPFDQAYINLVDQETGSYSVSLLFGVEQPAGEPELIKIPEGSQVQNVVASGKTAVREDIETGPRLHNDLAHMNMGLRSSITVPLANKGRVLGALELLGREAAMYGQREVAILERLARHMAPAVENARLYDQTRAEKANATTTLSQLWAVLDGVDAAIMLANDKHEVLWANRKFGEFFGLEEKLATNGTGQRLGTLQEHINYWVADPYPFSDGENRIAADPDYAGPAEEIEISHPVRRTLQRFTTPVDDGRGERLGRLWVYYDISEQRQLEEQVIQAQKMETVGRLAGGVAHDFNNMLSVITINAELAMRESSGNDDLDGYLTDISQATQRAAALTRQLLIFSRGQTLEPKILDLNGLIVDLYKMLRQLIGEHIEFVVPTFDQTSMVKVDPSQLEQVLMNLAVNASDAMPSGGKFIFETANVSFDDESTKKPHELPPGEYVRLTVTDTGTGISDEDKTHIFEPFFTTKEVGKGTGLGLSTCYGIIKQSNGHIEVQSQLGQGTTFKIYLPRITDAAEIIDGVSAPAPLPRGTETVLVVEDEPLVLSTVVRVLTNQGYQVLQASNGEEGLRTAERHIDGDIDLLLTDSVMPKMGGLELARRLRVLRPGIKVLFTSGYMDFDHLNDGTSPMGEGVAFIQKPLTPDALARKVREILELREA